MKNESQNEILKIKKFEPKKKKRNAQIKK